MALDFQKDAAEGNSFLEHLAKELGYPNDKAKAGRVLQASLHGLRGQISIRESIEFMSQFPVFLKAVYVNQWELKNKRKRINHINNLAGEIMDLNQASGAHDFSNKEDVENSLSVLLTLLMEYISPGGLQNIESDLPKAIRALLKNSELMD